MQRALQSGRTSATAWCRDFVGSAAARALCVCTRRWAPPDVRGPHGCCLQGPHHRMPLGHACLLPQPPKPSLSYQLHLAPTPSCTPPRLILPAQLPNCPTTLTRPGPPTRAGQVPIGLRRRGGGGVDAGPHQRVCNGAAAADRRDHAPLGAVLAMRGEAGGGVGGQGRVARLEASHSLGPMGGALALSSGSWCGALWQLVPHRSALGAEAEAGEERAAR